MAKPFRDIIGKPVLPKKAPEKIVPNQTGYTPKPGDEKKFAALHVTDDNEDRNGNEDSHFKGVTKTYDREPRMGYKRGEDKNAYFAPSPPPDKTVGEEEEQIDELSKKTLGSYVTKATGDVRKRAHREMVAPSDTKHVKKNVSRMHGISKAVNKLTKEEEQVDELEKKTLGRYIKAASSDMAKNRSFSDMHLDKSINSPDAFDKRAHADSSSRHFKKAINRRRGIGRATDRLTKESALPLRAIIPFIDEGEVKNFPVGRNNPNWGHAHHGNAQILKFKKKDKKETKSDE